MTITKIAIWLLILGLVACQADEPLVTPPIVPVASPTTAAEIVPPANTQSPAVTPLPPTDMPLAEPEAPTAAPVATTTPLPPTETPRPSQPVNAIQLVPIATEGINRSIYLTHAGDGRLFVVQQNGIIRIIEDGQVIEEPFLNIQDQIGLEANEQGLLSIAFHPDFGENGQFFINYTNADFHTTISRFQVSAENPSLADHDSEKILLTIPQPYPNHNGGLVKFGPDGFLYIGMGDGGNQGDPQDNGQDAGSLLGAILRIDVDSTGSAPYGVPASNPLVEDDSGRNEIWATGWRNPWRFSFDRETADLFIADVGQNQWEEIHWQPAGSQGGENYGWNIMEGSHCYQVQNCDTTGLEMPIFEYDHTLGCSITGGYVYRGEQFPELYGNYFLGDFCSGNIWRLFPAPDGSWESALILQSGLDIASFGEDVNGELYVVSRNSGVFQIQP